MAVDLLLLFGIFLEWCSAVMQTALYHDVYCLDFVVNANADDKSQPCIDTSLMV